MRIAIASCQRLPEEDVDQEGLVAAIEAAGAHASVLAWDDPQAPFADHDLVVLRSTWNYFERVDAFVAWADDVAAATRLLNPAVVVRWNTRKTYLAELEARGVRVVETEFVRAGERRSVRDIAAGRGFGDIVVKPVVSAGSFSTERFRSGEEDAAQRFLDALTTDRDAMVQRWMPSVETYGERSLVWIDGEVTHAVRKSPRFSGGVEQVSAEVPIAEDERALASAAVAPFAHEILYARIDMVRDDAGKLRIMELELVEPSLFFAQAPRALPRFVAAMMRRARDAR